MDFLVISLRNVFRNKRRSILNVIALSIGIAMMIIGMGWVRGYHTYVYTAVMNFDTGQLQVLHPNYLSEGRRYPLDLTIGDYESTRQLLLNDPQVEEISGRITFPIQLSKGEQSVQVLGRAVDPEPESQVTVLKDNIVDGEYLSMEQGILIGKPLAEKLSLKTGDTVFLTARDKFQVPNFTDVKVVGIYEYGYPAIDDTMIFTNLETADFLLDMENEVTAMAIRLKPGVKPEQALPVISESLSSDIAAAYLWKRFAETTVSGIEADTEGFQAMLVVMFILIIIGILNSMSMSIQERTREIGTLRAIGMKKRELFRMVLLESFWIGMISIIAAIILTTPLAYYLQFHGLDFGSFIPEGIPIPFGERMHADFIPGHFLLGGILGVVTALAGSIIPGRRAAGMVISRAMRDNQM